MVDRLAGGRRPVAEGVQGDLALRAAPDGGARLAQAGAAAGGGRRGPGLAAAAGRGRARRAPRHVARGDRALRRAAARRVGLRRRASGRRRAGPAARRPPRVLRRHARAGRASFSLVVTFAFVEEGHDEIRDAYLEAYGGSREEFERALRVGTIAHLFKWIRFRDVLPAEMLPEYDGWFRSWIADAVAQT